MLSDLANSIYINGMITGSSAIVAILISLPFMKNMSRREGMLWWSVASFLCAIPLLLFFSCYPSSSCSAAQKNYQTANLFIVRIGFSVSSNIYNIWVIEVLPSQIRSLVLQMTFIGGRLATLLMPAIQSLFSYLHISVIFTFLIASVLMVLVSLWVKETLGVPPPEMIE